MSGHQAELTITAEIERDTDHVPEAVIIVTPTVDGHWLLSPNGKRIRLMQRDAGGSLQEITPGAVGAGQPALTPEDEAMSAEIDQIQTRLDAEIPKLRREMEELLARIRLPPGTGM